MIGQTSPLPNAVAWRPSATHAALQARARLKDSLRTWFAERGVLEVDTPVLVADTVSDPATPAVAVPLGAGRKAYLATSPEYAMKRLLAAGSGSIYQMGPVFRADESGRTHRVEFTMVEWYRVGQTLAELMADVADLLTHIGFPPARKVSYRERFFAVTGLDPITADLSALAAAADALAGRPVCNPTDRGMLLDLIFGLAVAPGLGCDGSPLLIYGFPAAQAALARLDPEDREVACRAEVFVNGLELGNGYEELTDAAEQARRFAADNQLRSARGLLPVTPDRGLLAALDHGLPACSGMAMGLERLQMALTGVSDIAHVQAFAHELADDGSDDRLIDEGGAIPEGAARLAPASSRSPQSRAQSQSQRAPVEMMPAAAPAAEEVNR